MLAIAGSTSSWNRLHPCGRRIGIDYTGREQEAEGGRNPIVTVEAGAAGADRHRRAPPGTAGAHAGGGDGHAGGGVDAHTDEMTEMKKRST